MAAANIVSSQVIMWLVKLTDSGNSCNLQLWEVATNIWGTNGKVRRCFQPCLSVYKTTKTRMCYSSFIIVFGVKHCLLIAEPNSFITVQFIPVLSNPFNIFLNPWCQWGISIASQLLTRSWGKIEEGHSLCQEGCCMTSTHKCKI